VRYGRIENNAVVELLDLSNDVSIVGMFHPSLVWVPVSNPAVDQGWSYNGGTFAPPPSPGDPEPPASTVSFLDFLGLFTSDEQAAIIASEVVHVKLFVLIAAGAGTINLDDPRVAEGLDLLVAESLLTVERRDEVFAGQAPV
jgi:hypothetical protein